MRSTPIPPVKENDPVEATLVFHEQADGRKVSRLAGGKVVLLNLNSLDRVRDGNPSGNYSFRSYVIVGSLENVRVSMQQLFSAIG